MIHLSPVDQIMDINTKRKKKSDKHRIPFPILWYTNVHISFVMEISQLLVVHTGK